jgi:hypothetical protein
MRLRLALAMTALCLAAQDPSLDSARKLVQAFYADHLKGDMGFTKASVKAKSRYLAPDLLKACLVKQAENPGPDTVPDVDGDPFTDSQEYPTGFKLGKARSAAGGARIPVTFSWREGTPPRTLTVILKNLQAGWRIDDIRYPEGGTLRQLVKPAGPLPE